MGKQLVTVVYDDVEHAIIARGDRDRVMARAKVMPDHALLEVSGGTFHWNKRRLQPVDDDYGLAVAFAHFVNGRRARSPAEIAFGDPFEGVRRWQYGVVNIGMFSSADRMSEVLSAAGSGGWELVSVYDKGSNWMNGMEKGFMLFKRGVPDGVQPDTWCVSFRN